MIYDKIENAPRYRGISPALDEALKLIQGDLDKLPLGRQQAGHGVYYTVSDTPLKPFAETKWEFHKRYIDIQIGFQAGEVIGVLPDGALKQCGAYDAENDICFASDPVPGLPVPLDPGMFLVLFPTDAHRPCIAACDPTISRKLVVKVPV